MNWWEEDNVKVDLVQVQYEERHLVSMHDKEDDRGLNLGCLIDTKASSVGLIFMDRFEDHKNIKKQATPN